MRRGYLWLVALVATLLTLVGGCSAVTSATRQLSNTAQVADDASWVGAQNLVSNEILQGRPQPEPGEKDKFALASNARRGEVVAIVNRSNNFLEMELTRIRKTLDQHNTHIVLLVICVAVLTAALVALSWLLGPWKARRLKSVVTTPSSSSSPAGSHPTATPSGIATPAEPVTSTMSTGDNDKSDTDALKRAAHGQVPMKVEPVETGSGQNENEYNLTFVAIQAMKEVALAAIQGMSTPTDCGGKPGTIAIKIYNGGGGGGGACIASPLVAPNKPVAETPAQEEEPLQIAS